MYSTCLHCTRPLGANQVLETLPIGRRVAFDAGQGRLWVVCRHCAKWNLVPFDTRLETIDACERIYRDTTTRYSTGTIGLARHREGLDLVRIGPALRPEFAAWRFGESHRRRRRSAVALTTVGSVSTMAVVGAIGGVGWGMGIGMIGAQLAMHLGTRLTKVLTDRQLGVVALHPRSGKRLRLGPEEFVRAMVTWEEDRPVFELPLPGIASPEPSYLSWAGLDVPAHGRRVVGGLNALTGSRRQLEAATSLLAERGGDLGSWMREVTIRDARIGGPNASWRFPGTADAPRARQLSRPYLRPAMLPTHERLALEMWMNEDIERIWLEGELKLLEREWREADRLAKIADELVIGEDEVARDA